MPEPRIGFAYDVFSNNKTILRGGFGMMHDRTQGNLIFNTVFNNPAVVQTASVSANNVVNLPTLQGSFGNGVLSNVLGASRDGKVPTVYSFSLGVQHELGRDMTLDVAYVGTMSRHLVTSRDINVIPYGAAFSKDVQDPDCVDNQDPAQPVFPGGVVPDVQPDFSRNTLRQVSISTGSARLVITTSRLRSWFLTRGMARSRTWNSTGHPTTTHCRFRCRDGLAKD